MILPWALLGRLALGAVAAVALLAVRRRPIGARVDLLLGLVVGGAVGGRAAVLLLDLVLLGTPPDPRALLTPGPGLLAPGALVGAAVAGWRRRSVDRGEWRDVAAAAAVGIAAASAPDLLDPSAEGVIRVVGLLGVAVWVLRGAAEGWHPALRLLGGVAAVHLLAGAATPGLATPDADLDVLLTGAVLLGVVLTHTRLPGAVRRSGLLAVGVLAGLLVAAVVVPGAGSSPLGDAVAAADLEGAIVAGAGTDPASVPAWGVEELAGLTRGQGSPVVVNLWAAWCPPCHAEAGALARAAEALRGRAVVLGVLVDDDPADGQAFADRYGLGFPTVVDDGLSAGLGMTGLPTTVVLDAEGRVVERVVGGVSQRALADAVARAETGPG